MEHVRAVLSKRNPSDGTVQDCSWPYSYTSLWQENLMRWHVYTQEEMLHNKLAACSWAKKESG